jgi:hypothetical protein
MSSEVSTDVVPISRGWPVLCARRTSRSMARSLPSFVLPHHTRGDKHTGQRGLEDPSQRWIMVALCVGLMRLHIRTNGRHAPCLGVMRLHMS